MKKRLFLRLGIAALVTLGAAELLDRWLFPEPDWSMERLKRASLVKVPSFFNENRLAAGPRQVLISRSHFGGRDLVYPINSLGIRGKEIPPARTGVARIAVLGGSATFDISASHDLDWVSAVGKQLGEERVQMMNFGIPGALSITLALRLLTEIHHYRPDFVILNLIYNDLAYFHLSAPLFVQSPRVSRNPFLTPFGLLDQVASEHSHFYSHLRRLYLLKTTGTPKDGMGVIGGAPAAGRLDGPTEAGLAQYRQSIAAFLDAARRTGAVPVLVVEPAFVSRKADPGLVAARAQDFELTLSTEGLIRSHEAARTLLRELAARERVRLFDVFDEMAGRPDFFVDHMHFSPAGRAFFVRRLSGFLERALRRSE